MLKESRFTYKTDDGLGGLLLYNTMIGVSSFLNIPKIYVHQYEELLNGNHNAMTEKQVNELLQRGIIVSQSKNETLALKRKYIDVIGEDTLNLIINPTEHCNFKCKYCYETFENGRISNETIQGIIKYVEKNIHKYRKLNVMWFGGEPLLELDVIEKLSESFISICKKNKKVYTSDITTNGYLLDKNTFERLAKCRVLSYQITIDGYQESHDSQRISVDGRPTYNTIINNIISMLKNDKYRHFIITVRVNVSKDLFDNFEQFLYEYNQLFADEKRVYLDIHVVGNWLGKAEKNFVCKIMNSDEIREIYKKVLRFSPPIHNISHSFLNPGGRVCYSGKSNTIMLSSNGTIHKCTLLFNLPDSVIGQIGVDGRIIEYNIERDQKWLCNDENCSNIKECFYAPVCFGDSCPSAHSGFYDYEDTISGCPNEKNSLDLLLKILHRDKPFKMLEEL